MKLKDKINILDNKLSGSLIQLNEILNVVEKHEKGDILKVIEIHISYMIFLKELEIELKEEKKGFTKEFLIKQFKNIKDSCLLVEDIYKEKIDK